MPGALFDFVDVVVQFGDAVVLDHITTTIADGGGITCLLGPSGAGKSTLLRLCNRLEVPASGRIVFRSDDIDDLDPLALRRRVGMVFQRPALFPGTVRDNFLVACPEGDADLFTGSLERAHLPMKILDRDASTLSGGEAQRACLARTLVTRPEVLLMDEPTSALDPAATDRLERLGRELADDGMPLLWVTHDLRQADRIADDRRVFVGGRLADVHQAEHFLAGEESFHHHHDDGDEHSGHEDTTHVDHGHASTAQEDADGDR